MIIDDTATTWPNMEIRIFTCPNRECGWNVSETHFQYARYDMLCPRCKQHLMSTFTHQGKTFYMTRDTKMTLRKLFELLNALHAWNGLKGMIETTSGGEIAFDFNSQPDRATDQYLRRKGFIVEPGSGRYIYRPV
jgi:hypothetical protein